MVKRWLSILLILMLAGPALGVGANVYLKVKGHGGGYLTSGYAACYDGGVSVGPINVNGSISPNPPNVAGRVYIKSNSYLSSSTTGPDFLYDSRSSKTVSIVAWEGASINSVITAQGYYGIKSYTTSGQGATPANVPGPGTAPGDFTLNYRAAPPPPPSASAGGFNLTWDDTKEDYLVAFSVNATAGTEYTTQYNSSAWALQVVRTGDDWSTAMDYSGQSASVVEEDPDAPYYVADGSYTVRAKAGNNFGDSEWGSPTTFVIPAGGGGGVSTSFTFDLLPAEAEKLVVNSITVPANNLSQPKVATVSKASELADVINDYAVISELVEEGVKVVVAVYKWNPDTGKAEGVAFDLDGNPIEGSVDFDIQPGMGVQVYTTIEIANITFKGQ